MKKLFLITLVFTFLPTITTLAQINYYVDPTGTDDLIHGTGTGTGAWKTIEYAVNNAANPTTAEIIINVSGDTFTLNSNTIDINRGFTNLTIQGAGSGSTIVQAAETEGTATNRVFWLSTSETVTLKDLTIRNGNLSSDRGAGISNDNCILTLINCSISGNKVINDYAGGIKNSGTTANLTMTNCTISGNTATYGAGGIQNDMNSILTMTNCTLSGNTTSRDGGGILNWYDATLTITNCTIANNTCGSGDYYGGGIYNSSTLYIKNTILANNENSNGTAEDFYSSGTLQDNGYNICEYGYWYGFSGTNNILGEQSNLNLSTTLESNNTLNGTYTLKTTNGSVAINAGSSSGTNNGVAMPTLDQRGAERNGVTDIGAYEYWADDAPLPVELTSFSASVVSGKVVLTWSTATEVNNYGFEIFRFTQNTKWEKMGFVHGHGNSNSLKVYTFMDNTPPSGKIKYRLKQIDFNGVFEYSNDVETNNFLPTNFSLHQNYPNPFNPETTIEYTIPANVKGEPAKVTLKVYDLLGREVATLVDEFKQAGNYKVTFNVETGHGVSLPSGVYFYKLHSGTYSETKKLILIK